MIVIVRRLIKWPNRVLLASKFPLVIFQYYIGDEDLTPFFAASLMAKIDLALPLPPFDPFSNPSSLSQRWRIFPNVHSCNEHYE